jgi:hypothetical protein
MGEKENLGFFSLYLLALFFYEIEVGFGKERKKAVEKKFSEKGLA